MRKKTNTDEVPTPVQPNVGGVLRRRTPAAKDTPVQEQSKTEEANVVPANRARTPRTRAKAQTPDDPTPKLVANKKTRESSTVAQPPIPATADERVVVTFRPRASAQSQPPTESSRTARKPRNAKSASEQEVARAEPVDPTPAPKPRVPRAERNISATTTDELPIPSWRPKSGAESNETEGSPARNRRSRRPRKDGDDRPITAADALRQPAPDSTEGDQSREPRARTRRGRKPLGAGDEQGTVAPVVESKTPAIPMVEMREAIPIPEDAPQIVVRDGVASIVRNLQAIPPIFFFGAAMDERRVTNVFEQIKLASETGIHQFIHFVELEVSDEAVDAAVSTAAYLLARTLTIDPKAQVLFRVVFAAPNGWERTYPDAKFTNAQGELAEPSFFDDEFWNAASRCLVRFVQSLRMLENQENILGIHLDRGEWFYARGWGYDTSRAALKKFKEWLQVRYRGDEVALRASWFDGRVTFENLTVPEFRAAKNDDFVQTGRKARRWVDFHLFTSDAIVDRIGKLAFDVKKASKGYFLVGVSYGYTFEWDHAASGHLSVGKLLRTPEVDIIAGPPSYSNREPGGTGPFPGPIDSFALSNKLYISEEDYKTPFSERMEPDDFNPVIRTPQALESVHWRGAGAALAHGTGVAWMDLWGNGWLNSPGIWDRGGQIREALTQRIATPAGDPDMAVFIDERSLAYLADPRAFKLLVQDVREAVLRSGLSVGFYLLSDLAHRERFPECKLNVFLNAWDVRPEVRSAIKNRLQGKGNVLFWLYAAGLFDGGREALERVREITGIALKPQPFASKSGTTLLNKRHPLCEALPADLIARGSQLEPSYFAIPEEGTVLGEYTQTGLPSFLMREFRSEEDPNDVWTSVFLGEPVVTPALFRALGQMAGCQAWNYHDDVVHVRVPFLTVHCTNSGARSVTLPDKWAAYDVTAQGWAATDSTHLRFSAMDGRTQCFLVGPKADIEAVTSQDPVDFLKFDTLPARPENTLRQEDAHFDVAIMKLDEWMEEGWTEEMADDLLLKPSQLDIEPIESTEDLAPNSRTTSRRRKRRRRGSGDQDEFPGRETGERVKDNELGLSIVFRKRD